MNMNNISLTGNRTVDFLGSKRVEGDIIPQNLYHLVKKESGTTDLLAIIILSNIIYWHRPTLTKDSNGSIIGYKTKFHGQYLQKDYEEYALMYDVSKRQVKAAFDTLVNLGFIKRHFDTLTLRTGKRIPNVMFIELDLDKLKLIFDEDTLSAPEQVMYDAISDNDISYKDSEDISQNDERYPTKICNTNTYNKTNIDTSNTLSIIHSYDKKIQKEPDEMNDESAYKEIIADNIELDSLLKEQPLSADEYREYFEIMLDLVCHNKRPIKCHGQLYPSEVVKSRMLKLRREHLEYVAEVYDGYVGDITDFYRHCAATLFNSYFEVNNRIRNKTNNNIYNFHVS